MRILIPAVYAVTFFASAVFGQQQPGAPAAPPVTGVIQAFDGKMITFKASDGSTGPVAIAPNVRITVSKKATLADIKPGDFIASGGTKGPDGVIRANEIRIFAAPGGEGQFPMAKPDQVMTNATVEDVMTGATVKQMGSADGVPVIKLTFHGAGAPGSANCTGRSSDAPGGAGKGCVGETQFEVPADVAVVRQLPGDVSMLKAGAKATLNMMAAPDGSMVVTRITISE